MTQGRLPRGRVWALWCLDELRCYQKHDGQDDRQEEQEPDQRHRDGWLLLRAGGPTGATGSVYPQGSTPFP